ncbi:hypothetical protein JCM10212_006439 [Sporobolomyces blumeae]
MSTELALTGLAPAALHPKLVSSLSRLCEREEAFTLVESVYRRSSSSSSSARAVPARGDEVKARVRGLRLKGDELLHEGRATATRWSITVQHKPEPARISPAALQYSVSELALPNVDGRCDPHEVVSAFGFGDKEFELYKRGTRWERSGVVIEVYQLLESPEVDSAPLDPHSYIVQATVRFSQPSSTSSITTTSTTTTKPGPSSSTSASNGRPSTPSSHPSDAKRSRESNTTNNNNDKIGVGGGKDGSTRGGTANANANAGQEAREKALRALEEIRKLLKGLVDLKRLE